jgi:hypothetical protein
MAAHGSGAAATRGVARACEIAPSVFSARSVRCAPVQGYKAQKFVYKLQKSIDRKVDPLNNG